MGEAYFDLKAFSDAKKKYEEIIVKIGKQVDEIKTASSYLGQGIVITGCTVTKTWEKLAQSIQDEVASIQKEMKDLISTSEDLKTHVGSTYNNDLT